MCCCRLLGIAAATVYVVRGMKSIANGANRRGLGGRKDGRHAHQGGSRDLFAPVGELVPPVLEALKPGGTLAMAGIYMTPLPQMDYDRYVFHERDIRSVTCNTRQDGRSLLAEAAEIPIRPRTSVYPLAEANRALQDLKHDRINGTGVLVV